ncbi:hypothetical protein [Caenimonas sp. SL110]|uniref:hypothetical protein n=1 Tax=Caenimonas sp. SL110 TaxID=1450524 RepID=UPI000654B836|nr:hypothetical protein [Caenimonas sp. SL110]
MRTLRPILAAGTWCSLLAACGGASDPVAPSAPLTQPQARPQAQATVNASVSAQIVDAYDAATNTLTIPLIQVGIGFYRDVQVTLRSLESIGVASNTSGVFDRYDPTTNQLTIPVLRLGDTLYKNLVVTLDSLVSYGDAVASYSVPLDLSLISYPQSYLTPTTTEADINPDPCNLNLSTITYPASWIGQFPLPAVQGAPLKPGIGRAVTLKDIGLQPGNPAFIGKGAPGAPAGCSGDLRAALTRTVGRLKTLGTEYVTIMQWHWASNRVDGSWYITPAELTDGSMTDADLAFFVQAAHGAGIKVIMRNQIQGFFDRSNPTALSVPARTLDNYAKWFGAYQEYILERGVFFQGLGVDVWELGCVACFFHDSGDGSDQAVAVFYAGYKTALANLKLNYSGKTLMGSSSWLHEKADLASQIDIFEIGLGAPYPADQTGSLTVAAYKAALAGMAPQQMVNLYDGFGKSIMVSYGMQSRRSMFSSPGYMEETSCTSEIGAIDMSPDGCIQREAITDFSMQAIVHEASLELINQLSASSTLIASVGDYWETDSLMPFTAFPNIAVSFRNKPAEGIVKAWFAK